MVTFVTTSLIFVVEQPCVWYNKILKKIYLFLFSLRKKKKEAVNPG